jgi:hypothetical protein
MPFVKANPNEFLVVGRRGKVTNRGLAASSFLWPGSTFVLIPSTQQEATFEMTQESKDSIPLRFKGIVVYRVTDAEAAARRFDFSHGAGHEQIKALLSHVCLGELRAVVAHLSMDECIEQRKTTLTDAVATALRQVIHGRDGEPGWGIDLDVVQVAQVFIVDAELHRQLEAGVHNAIRVKSELSEVRTREEIKLAEALSDRRLQQEGLELEREKTTIAREKLRLEKDFEREKIEAEAPNRLLQIEKQVEVLRRELGLYEVQAQVKERKVHAELIEAKAKQDLRKEILPLEQTPAIAEALSRMLHGVNLSVYGQEAPLLGSLAPLVDLLVNAVRSSLQPRPPQS